MSVTNTLPAPVIQMGLVEKFVEVNQNQPYVQQLVAQEMAKEALKEQSGRVRETEKPAEGKKVDDRQGGGNRQDARQMKDRQPGGGDDAEDAPPAKPWAGHILNLKI